MKSKSWLALLCALLAVCLVLSALLLRGGDGAAAVQVWSQGKLLYTLPLSVDRSVTVCCELGSNEITVADGRVAVTRADCPDGHCVNRGFCGGGAAIICLPHQLELRFVGPNQMDAAIG